MNAIKNIMNNDHLILRLFRSKIDLYYKYLKLDIKFKNEQEFIGLYDILISRISRFF